MFHRIAEIKALPNFMLWARFLDGAETVYDVSAIFDAIPAFRAFENTDGLFDQVRVDAHGYGICWNDELDLDADEIYENGVLLKSAVDLEHGKPCPTCGQMLRRKSDAQRNASIANLAKRHSKGGRPINPDSKRQRRLRPKTTA